MAEGPRPFRRTAWAGAAAVGFVLNVLILAASASGQLAAAPAPATFFIREYRVSGAKTLPRDQVEAAVYPFLGPSRTRDDVEAARAALEKAYRDLGYQSVAVQIPEQRADKGVVRLRVLEGVVGRLRVKGARYYSPQLIREMAPSVAEGKVVDFNTIPRDMVALNQVPDRRVTPALRQGSDPGTVDIDLNVKDTLPVHGSLELNNRYSPNTSSLRLNGAVSDNNALDRGDSAGLSFQLAPQRMADAKVLSAYYLARFPRNPDLSVLLQGTKQDSAVSTLGGAAVAGRGEIAGARVILVLSGGARLYQSLSLGFDFKHFEQNVAIAGTTLAAPITYFPVTAAYAATAGEPGRLTELNAAVTLHLRGLGSSPATFDTRRYDADGGFIYLRADASHTRSLPLGWEAFGKVQGQLADRPLLDSEESSGGGLGTVRGYPESTVIGDSAVFGTVEIRGPSLARWLKRARGEWRIYAFADGGAVFVNRALPEQASHFTLASYGLGTRIRMLDHFNGSLDAALPLISQDPVRALDPFLTFRMWSDF